MSPQGHGVAAGSDVFHPLVKDGLEDDGCRGSTVPGLVMDLPDGLAREHRTDILVAVGQLNDAARDGAGVVQKLEGGRAGVQF